MRAVRFVDSVGGQTLSWTADADYELSHGVALSGDGVVSFDPQMTFNTATGDLATLVDDVAIWGISSPNMIFPVLKGQEIFVAFQSLGTCVLYLKEA